MTKLVLACTVAFGLSLGVATGAVISRDSRSSANVTASTDSSTLAKDSLLAGIDSTNAVAGRMLDSTSSFGNAGGLVAEHAAGVDTNSINTLQSRIASELASGLASGVGSGASSESKKASLENRGSATASRRGGGDTADSNESALVTRIAAIFAAMSTKDAARVLSEMDNADLQRILLSLPRKQQAAILGSLSTERAATIAKATLRDTL